jgi:hypothetical protein
MYAAKVTVCPEICTKLSTQSEDHVGILNVKPGGTQKKKKKSWVLKGYGTILK